MTLESELKALREQREREITAKEAERSSVNNEINERRAFLDGIARKRLQPCVEFVRRTECINILDSLVQLEGLDSIVLSDRGRGKASKGESDVTNYFEAVFESKDRRKKAGRGSITLRYYLNSVSQDLVLYGYRFEGGSDLELLRMVDDKRAACEGKLSLAWGYRYSPASGGYDFDEEFYQDLTLAIFTDDSGRPTQLSIKRHQVPITCLKIEGNRPGKDEIAKTIAQAYMGSK